MHKFYLLPILWATLCLQGYSQSLQYQNATLYLQGNPAGFEIESHVDIINASGTSLDVLAARTINNLVGNQFSYFCWGTTCYPPQTDTALYSVSMAPGAVDTSFIGYLDPVGTAGIATVTYCFYDMANVQDSICLEFVYDFTTGIGESGKAMSYLSAPAPNPASGFSMISYRLANPALDARLVIRNAMGTLVRNFVLSGAQSTILLNARDLAPGLYFYSLVAGHQVLGTRKLVVSEKH